MKLNPSLTKKKLFFDNKDAVPNSYEWLIELHGHLLAKFCFFFYDVFMSTPKIGNLEPAEGFQKLCSQTRFDFYGRIQELFKTMESSSALYLIRDHRPSKSENYSSTSKYVFMPFIKEVTNNDAKGDRIGVVSWYRREGNKIGYSNDEENLKKALEAYQKKKEETAARSAGVAGGAVRGPRARRTRGKFQFLAPAPAVPAGKVRVFSTLVERS